MAFSMLQRIKGRIISKGIGEGSAVVTHQPLSFLGGVDPTQGVINDPKHELYGTSIVGTILTFPQGKGSTVGSYVMYQLKRNGKAPAAIINVSSETIVAVGAIISNIPLIDKLEVDPIAAIKSGSRVLVNCVEGFIEVEK
jgi:phosphomecalonate degydratase small subunit